ncbi:putative Late nodulin [Medicago truncatula]|uniref:Nodule Cysteine-Rich (NCR) secreted peptide n=1 Tax=Medicago truncatula TaxID=3880 RepID=A0A072VIH1_MEDTR|nr:Nodule Cysteine-Rich (NCR) secreted peptide [Medicago truncatula]RHN74106.1 putative Late nodulin [Medicago truncatula]
MTKILNVFYAAIIFLSIFLYVTNCSIITCESDEDCPTSFCIPPQIPKCRTICECITKTQHLR